MCEERLRFFDRYERQETSLNTRHACFRFFFLRIPVILTLLDCDKPGGQGGGALHPSCFFYGIVPIGCWGGKLNDKLFGRTVKFETW
jgi:hypothetical protein